jgi:hypothetical protein
LQINYHTNLSIPDTSKQTPLAGVFIKERLSSNAKQEAMTQPPNNNILHCSLLAVFI